jgi:hypothetical protein
MLITMPLGALVALHKEAIKGTLEGARDYLTVMQGDSDTEEDNQAFIEALDKQGRNATQLMYVCAEMLNRTTKVSA